MNIYRVFEGIRISLRDERNHHGSRTVDPTDGEAITGATGCKNQLFGVLGISKRVYLKIPDTPSDAFVNVCSI